MCLIAEWEEDAVVDFTAYLASWADCGVWTNLCTYIRCCAF